MIVAEGINHYLACDMGVIDDDDTEVCDMEELGWCCASGPRDDAQIIEDVWDVYPQ